MKKPADLFHPKSPCEKACDAYFAMHLEHTERELDYLDRGKTYLANEEHEAARIALNAYNVESLHSEDA